MVLGTSVHRKVEHLDETFVVWRIRLEKTGLVAVEECAQQKVVAVVAVVDDVVAVVEECAQQKEAFVVAVVDDDVAAVEECAQRKVVAVVMTVGVGRKPVQK